MKFLFVKFFIILLLRVFCVHAFCSALCSDITLAFISSLEKQ